VTTNPHIFAIAGPTASGKTALAVELALHLGDAEIVNFDSVQVYDKVEIATAKPTAEEMKGVPHHLIGYIDPSTNCTAADWAHDATEKIHEIESRGKTVILVGGTGFYLRTLRQPLFEGPSTDPEIRNRLLELKEEKGAEHLHRMLMRLDAEAAEGIPPADFIRSTRALEVYFQTGKRISEVRVERGPAPEFSRRMKLIVLDPPRDALYERINSRAAAHFANGLVEEVRALLKDGVPESSNALGAHGYRRVCECLRGERTLESAIEKTQQNVRNYAKRQITWFKKENPNLWIRGFGDSQDSQNELFGWIGSLKTLET
jgi:tRNA dimethylallyltransferase